MSVATFVTDDLFVIRIVKSHVSNPDRKWTNTYEFKALEDGTEGPLLALLTNVVQFEKGIHTTFTNFERGLVSTWEADSKPYNPEAFISTPLGGHGLRDTTGELEPLNVTLSVSRPATTGRFGHIFYRGVLSEGDTASPAGGAVLVNPTVIQDLIDTTLDDSGLSENIGLTPAGFAMVLVSKDGSQVRNVVGLVASGVTTLPEDHAWFNRTGPTP